MVMAWMNCEGQPRAVGVWLSRAHSRSMARFGYLEPAGARLVGWCRLRCGCACLSCSDYDFDLW